MENYYTGYTKIIDNKTYYFVKKFIIFPETASIPPILETYGMHTDFNKACAIAKIDNAKIREQVLAEIENNTQQAKVIEFNNDVINKKKAR